MDEHGKWVVDEVVNDPFPNSAGDISTIPTSTFTDGDTMYTSVMNVKNWDDKHMADGQFPAIQVDRRRPHVDTGGPDMAEHRPRSQSAVSGAELLAER